MVAMHNGGVWAPRTSFAASPSVSLVVSFLRRQKELEGIEDDLGAKAPKQRGLYGPRVRTAMTTATFRSQLSVRRAIQNLVQLVFVHVPERPVRV